MVIFHCKMLVYQRVKSISHAQVLGIPPEHWSPLIGSYRWWSRWLAGLAIKNSPPFAKNPNPYRYTYYWLVVWNMFFFKKKKSILYMGCHPSHWRTPSFFRGVGIPPISSLSPEFVRTPSNYYEITIDHGYFPTLRWLYIIYIYKDNG